MAKPRQTDKNYIAVMGKMFAVLECLAVKSTEQGVPFAEISKELPFSRTTIHRILYSLEKLGCVEKADTGSRYRLARKFLELTGQAVQFGHLKAVAKSVMQNLLIRYGETVNLGVIDNGLVAHVEVFQSPSALRIAALPGDRNPVHSTALGKAILAFLPESKVKEILGENPLIKKTSKTITQKAHLLSHLASVHKLGVASDMEENLSGVTCVAAPIFDHAGHVVAAFSISGPTSRMSAKLSAIKKDIREAALTVTRMIAPPKVAESTAADIISRTGHDD